MSCVSEKIYLDYNATTPLASEVVYCIKESLEKQWANPSSSSDFGKNAKQTIDSSRRKIADMLNCSTSDVVFVSGGTEANNMVLWTALEYFNSLQNIKDDGPSKPHIITTNVEHDAVKLPLIHYKKKNWADVDYVPVSIRNGQVLTKEILLAIKPNTCLISIILANNETGVLMPVSEISRSLNEVNIQREAQGLCKIFLHSDAAQAIGKIKVDTQELGVDYLTVVGHKFYGPRIGALFVKGLGHGITPLHPMLFGGGQECSFRPGTENTPMIHGLGCAAELVSKHLVEFRVNMLKTRDLLEDLLNAEFGQSVIINCDQAERLPNTSNVSFKNAKLTGAEILARCPNLMASTGAACHKSDKPSAILIASGVSPEDARSAVRLSVGRETTKTQIRQVVEMLKFTLNGE